MRHNYNADVGLINLLEVRKHLLIIWWQYVQFMFRLIPNVVRLLAAFFVRCVNMCSGLKNKLNVFLKF